MRRNKAPENNLLEFLQIKNETETSADLYFYGDIVSDSWSAWADEDQYPESVRDFLKDQSGKELNIYINSGGGSVFAGVAIYNMLKRHNGVKTVHVDGLAASIASVIALVGDKIIVPKTAMIMVHKPWMGVWRGYNAPEFRKMADDLDNVEKVIMNVYEENLKEDVKISTIQELVNNETWLTGDEASKYFNIEVTDEVDQKAACISEHFKNYKNVPKDFIKKEPKEHENNNKDKDLEKEKLLIELDLI
jgi:ATP-dependent protease ClpP protease subunit